jgi:iron complex outermembrane receptor protein
MRLHPRAFAPSAFAALFWASLSSAQTIPPPPVRPTAQDKADKPAGEESTLKLSPFEVSSSRDTGYIAADTLSAGRLSTNLLMTPGDIDVFTRDLINDLGVFNIDEASGWLTNSRPLELGAIEGNSLNPGSLAQSDSATNVSLRGLGGQPSTRNYFVSASTPKEYNVERVESSRGPNAILYGEGGPGGQVNYITKRALTRNFSTLRFRTDSLWSKGVSLDVNRRLTDKLSLRYNGNLMDQRYYISRSRFKEVGNSLNVIYRPFEGTTVTVDADFSRNSRPGLIMTYGEQYAKWNGVPIAGKITAAQATAAGVQNWTGAHYYTYVEGQGMLDLTGYAHTIGYGLPIPTENDYPSIFPGIGRLGSPDRGFNANPTQTNVVDHARDVQVSIDHTFKNNFSLQLAGQYSKYLGDGGNYTFTTVYLDPMSLLPDGKINPNYGKPLSSSFVGRTLDAEREAKSVRIVAAYPLKFLGGTTNLSAFAQHQEQDADTAYYDLHISDPTSTLPITDASSLIHVYRYWDNLPAAMPDFTKDYKTVNVPTARSITANKNDAIEVAVSGSYLKDRLSIIGGFRRDKSELTTKNGDLASRDAVSGAFKTYTIDNRSAYNNTTTVGLVYFPFRYIGGYVNHAEGFTIQTNSFPRLDGTYARANIVPAKDESYGLRFQLGDGANVKVIGSVGYYDAKQSNSAFSIGVGNINSLWFNHGQQSKYIATFSADPQSTAAANSITSSRSFVGTGWEASVTANVGSSFRLTLNGALPKTKQSDVGSDYLGYITTNMPQWEQWAADPANPTRAADLTFVNQIKQTVNNFQNGRAQNLTYKYRYNAFGVYTFSHSPLKALRAGLGVQFFGPSIIGNEINQPFNYVYAKSYHVVMANLGYPFKFGKRKVDVQVNIDNLFNYDKPLYSGLFVQSTPTGSSVNIPYGFKYQLPRAVRLTMTIPF